MIFCGYYTIGTPYERESWVLRESLDALGLAHDVVGIPRFKTWQQATQYKTQVVRAMLNKHQRRICYIDVDSIVLSKPDILDAIDADVAAVVFDRGELLSGVVMFENSPATFDLLDKWEAKNKAEPQTWDQRTLHKAIKEAGCKFSELPPAYNYIVGLSQKRYPGVTPVILATRGALKHKKEIDA